MSIDHTLAAQTSEYNTVEDEKLLTLIGNNQDRMALAELYERYRQAVGGFLIRGVREASLIDEIYNDVMLTVWRKAADFRGDSKVSTWIFAIAYRQRLSHSRKESKHADIRHIEFTSKVEENANVALQETLNETLQTALIELSEQHRAVIELMYFHGYSTSEIGEILNCPQNTVKSRLFHARKRLKKTLENDHSMLGIR